MNLEGRLLGLVLGAALTAGSASASTIDISFAQLALVYDGDTIRDANPEGPSPIVAFAVGDDGAALPGTPALEGATIDFALPGLVDIDANGDQVTSDETGFLELTIPGGETVQLSLNQITVNYLDINGTAKFAFAGALGASEGPAEIGQLSLAPATISLQATITGTPVVESGAVSSFSATSTGQVIGAVVAVPEPTTLVVLGLMATVGSAAAAMRARIG